MSGNHEKRQLFVHVDLDDLWAIGECYGVAIAERHQHQVYEDGVPRLLDLFEALRIRATFFVCGRDLAHRANLGILNEVLKRGHLLANHSWSHHLRFRELSESELEGEILRTHRIAQEELGVALRGFRAPGYGWTPRLLKVLRRCGYLYDSSLMPSPYGPIFRYFDNRIAPKAKGSRKKKTQYPRVQDAFHSLRPFAVVDATGSQIWELPVGTTPWLRLPWQASVCLQLGKTYFEFVRRLVAASRLSPFVFLLHGADATDFGGISLPELSRLRYFTLGVSQRVELLQYFLTTVTRMAEVDVAENWFEARTSCL